ncbi:hypothetical protein [Arthrobacter sp. H5]|uniref:hypothetical protein n=1 Tax=Arthrobacter sp. H5 TaxID=1267973 RepID=UPI000489F4C1|nr:hypothetical protein [Arthrobacter sp. H5]
MQRSLDISQFEPEEIHRYESVEDFLTTPIREGVSEIAIGDRVFHALFRNRGSETTLVTFASALPVKGWDTYPVFPGEKTAIGLKVNHLSMSDPNFAMEGRPATGWFLGTTNHRIGDYLPDIVNHATKAGVEGQAVLFGASAGGFGALLYGLQIPESVTLCVNPRVELLNKPTQFHRLAPGAFPDIPVTELETRLPVTASIPTNGQTNTVAYIQNVQDTPYFEGNLLPYLRAAQGNDRVWVHLVDTGPRHVMPDGPIVTDLLRGLIDNAPNWSVAMSALGFEQGAQERWALRQRAMMAPDSVVP